MKLDEKSNGEKRRRKNQCKARIFSSFIVILVAFREMSGKKKGGCFSAKPKIKGGCYKRGVGERAGAFIFHFSFFSKSYF